MPTRVAAGRPPGLPEGAHAKRGGARRRRASRPPSDRRERGADQPRRQAPQGMPGVQPGKSGVAAQAAREAAPDGALRGAQVGGARRSTKASRHHDCPHGLPRTQSQSHCAIHRGNQSRHFLAYSAQKNCRSGSRNQLRRCPPACRRAARPSRQARRYTPRSACRRGPDLPRSIHATERAEIFRPASARVAAICSAS